MIQLDAQTAHVISQAAGVLSPLAVAYVTGRHWPARTKALLNAAFPVLASVLADAVIAPGQTWATYVTDVVRAFVTAYVAHIFFSKTGVTEKVARRGVRDRDPAPPEGTDPGWDAPVPADPSMPPVPRTSTGIDGSAGTMVDLSGGGLVITPSTATIVGEIHVKNPQAVGAGTSTKAALRTVKKSTARKGARKATARRAPAKR